MTIGIVIAGLKEDEKKQSDVDPPPPYEEEESNSHQASSSTMKDSTSNQGPHHSFINKMKQIKDTLYDKVAGNFRTSMTKPDSKIMKANIKTFYEHKRFIEIDMRNPCMGVSGTDGAIEGAKEDRTRQLVELQNDLTKVYARLLRPLLNTARFLTSSQIICRR